MEPDGTRRAELVFAKTRVRPLGKRLLHLNESLSICRLELLALLLGITVAAFVKSAFDQPLLTRIFSDSMVTLWRLEGDPLTFRPWVCNRLKQIHRLTDPNTEFYYIRSEENVAADQASRGVDLKELQGSASWFHGPDFIRIPNYNYEERSIRNMSKKNLKEEEDQEKRISIPKPNCLTFGDPTFDCTPSKEGLENNMISHQLCLLGPADTILTDETFKDFWLKKDKINPANRGLAYKFTTWGKLVRVTGRVLQFIHKLKKKVKERKEAQQTGVIPKKKPIKLTRNLKVDESDKNKPYLNQFVLPAELITEAEQLLMRVCQYLTFKEEILSLSTNGQVSRSSSLRTLRPVWDKEKSLVRMTGRAPSTNLIILPSKHRIPELMVLWIHLTMYHLPTLTLRSRVEELGYFVLGGKNEYKRITKCCICKKPVPIQQEISNLPLTRFPSSTSYNHAIAVDFAGPYLTYGPKQLQPQKVWLMITACLVTRYITATVVTSMSTAAFLEAFRQYVAANGAPRYCYSDQGTNMVGAAPDLRKALRTLDWSKIQNHGQGQGWDWKFHPAKSSSFSGIVEIAVKLIKLSLTKALQFGPKNRHPKLTIEQFRTIVLEACALVNSRPLGPETWSHESEATLAHVSPAKLVFGRSIQIVPLAMTIRTTIDQGLDVSELYRNRKKILNLFWTEFKSGYLRSLKFSQKWREKFPGPVPNGTMVHYRDKTHQKAGVYQLGVVVDSQCRADGAVKTLTLKTLSNKNPITRDVRKCHLLEHDYLKLTKVAHSCLLQDL